MGKDVCERPGCGGARVPDSGSQTRRAVGVTLAQMGGDTAHPADQATHEGSTVLHSRCTEKERMLGIKPASLRRVGEYSTKTTVEK